MEIKQIVVPPALLSALTKQRFTYSPDPTTIYHMVWSSTDLALLVGVCGDGWNGAYEWFIWDEKTNSLRTSDVAFGSDFVALCCGLVESGASMANGDHDLFLAWERRVPLVTSSPAELAPSRRGGGC